MDRYLSYPGIQPVYLGDIDFLQSSVRDCFSMLLEGLTHQQRTKCILIEPTADKDGVICIDGEIMPYKYSSVENPTDIEIVVEYSGNRTFKNGAKNDCYEKRSARNSQSGVYRLSEFSKFSELLAKNAVYVTKSVSSGIDGVIEVNCGITQMSADRYQLDVNFKSHIENGVSEMIRDLKVPIPGHLSGTYYSPFTVDDSGGMKLVPARITLSNAGTSSCKMSITIQYTELSAISKGSLSVIIAK